MEQHPSPSAPNRALIHQRVRVSGLKAKPEYNGLFGKVVSYVEDKDRYGVMLEGRKDTLSLKEANLVLASAADGGGDTSAAEREIETLKQKAAVDKIQPGPWYNLAMAYHSRGNKSHEAVQAMDKAVFYMLQSSRPGVVDLSDPALKKAHSEFQVQMAISGAKLLETAVVGRADGELQVDASLGQHLVALADVCGARLPAGARSLVHHVYANVLRKMRRNDEAIAHFKRADQAAWDGGAGSRDVLSLAMVADCLSNAAMALGSSWAPPAPAPPAMRDKMLEAATAAREALGVTPAGHAMRADAQLRLARMISNVLLMSAGALGQLGGEARALIEEGRAMATSARAEARGRDPRLAALADQLLAPGQPLGRPPDAVPLT